MLTFSKYSGLGNDLIVANSLPLSKEKIIRLCDRHEGVGADGVIFFYRNALGKLEVEIYNSDGSNPSLCGNGMRCLFLHLHKNKFIDGEGEVYVKGKRYRGKIAGSKIFAELATPTVMYQKKPIEVDGISYLFDLIDTGVPHWVTQDPTFPFEKHAKTLRFHPLALSQGANVNLLLNGVVRTYERGVEGETLACGTGIAASAYSLHINQGKSLPLTLKTSSKRELTVDFKDNALWIEGPATFIFQGVIDLDIIDILHH